MGSLVAAILTIATVPAWAQWLHYPTPGMPRTPDGKPNLSAPAPILPDGKPDLSGIWEVDLDPHNPSNLGIKPEDLTVTPDGEGLQKRHRGDRPGARCLPPSLPILPDAPFKIIHATGMVVILYEAQTIFRQIFMDGRPLPKDPDPNWLGYSVGKWDGDTLVVDTVGFNEGNALPDGRFRSEALHTTERFRRRDFGHMEIQFKIDDPKVYTKPWSFKEDQHLLPDTELLEYICNENEKDLKHMVGQ
jgi:hypothetical protein